MAPEDIAVLVRGRAATELFAQVFETYGIPVASERRTTLAHTRLGAGVLAFGRAALPGGTANDVVTWLRTPGKLDPPDLADRLEVQVRRHEARTAADARWLWTQARRPRADRARRSRRRRLAAVPGRPGAGSIRAGHCRAVGGPAERGFAARCGPPCPGRSTRLRPPCPSRSLRR